MKEQECKDEFDPEMEDLSEKKPHEVNKNIEHDESKEFLKDNKNKEINKNQKFNKKYNFGCYRKGNMYIFLYDKHNNPIIVLGPEWIFFAFLILFVTIGFVLLFRYYWKFLTTTLRIIGILDYLLFFLVYTFIFISDPGISKEVDESIAKKEKGKYIYCNICKHWVTIESRTRHCSICGICIEGQDHHCSWTGKCIAKKNTYYFFFLIIWVVILIVYYALSFVYAHEKWYRDKREKIKLNRMKRKN
jgi:hypothetical protein